MFSLFNQLTTIFNLFVEEKFESTSNNIMSIKQKLYRFFEV